MMSSQRMVRVLLVDANQGRLRSLQSLIEDEFITIKCVASHEEALEAIERKSTHLVMVNETVRQLDGIALLQSIRERWPAVYRVLITDNTWPERLLDAVNKAGVQRIIVRQAEASDLTESLFSVVTDYLASRKKTDEYEEVTAVTDIFKVETVPVISDPIEGPVLIIISGGGSKKVIRLTDELIVGRNPSCDLCIPKNDISRQHAKITRQPSGTYLLEDLNSRNGTLVNQMPIKQRELKSGDIIQLGRGTRLLVRYE